MLRTVAVSVAACTVLVMGAGCELFKRQPLLHKAVEPTPRWVEAGTEFVAPPPPPGVTAVHLVSTHVETERRLELDAPAGSTLVEVGDHVEVRGPHGFGIRVHEGRVDLLRLQQTLRARHDVQWHSVEPDLLVWSLGQDAGTRMLFVRAMVGKRMSVWCEPADNLGVEGEAFHAAVWSCSTVRDLEVARGDGGR